VRFRLRAPPSPHSVQGFSPRTELRSGLGARSLQVLSSPTLHQRTAVYDPKTFIPHAASRRQAFAHCARFPVAATRRCMLRVSVTLWLTDLSVQLPVIALVSHYLTNKLIGRRPIPKRIVTSFPPLRVKLRGAHAELPHLSESYSSLWGTFLRVTHPSTANLAHSARKSQRV